MKKYLILSFLFIFLFVFTLPVFSSGNDYLYSEEYFDYLIECAQIEKNTKDEPENNQIETPIDFVNEEDVITSEYEPFKLRIIEENTVSPYRESFKKIDTKTIVPIGDSLSFYQNTSKTRNKYNSNDYKILAGVQYSPINFFSIESGLETNYRGYDQIPSSRKLYVTPSIYLGDKLSLSFYNKMNVQNYSSDHDIGLTFSPLKSKAVDFGVYTGLTRNQSGTLSRSVNFSTNFYLY